MPMIYRYLCCRCSNPVKWSASKKAYVHIGGRREHEVANVAAERVS